MAIKQKLASGLIVIAGCMPWVISCVEHDLPTPEVTPCDDFKTVSYLSDIKPIIDNNCSRCHNSGFVDKDWTDPAQLKNNATEVSRRVSLPVTDPQHMPQDPPELTTEELNNIVCWVAQGAPINN